IEHVFNILPKEHVIIILYAGGVFNVLPIEHVLHRACILNAGHIFNLLPIEQCSMHCNDVTCNVQCIVHRAYIQYIVHRVNTCILPTGHMYCPYDMYPMQFMANIHLVQRAYI
ncbi:unnamed protein product, partial [Owenia fusiformis]